MKTRPGNARITFRVLQFGKPTAQALVRLMAARSLKIRASGA
jgi:hypothetical protein